jgi:hypothetical protein
LGIDGPTPVGDDASGSERDYRLVVGLAIDRGLADRKADQVKVHIPLVRRRDHKVAERFRQVAWTASAWTDVTAMFGDPLDETLPRDPVLEVALDKTANWLTTLLPAAAESEMAELVFMYGQARLMYIVEPGRVVILALVPSLARGHRGIEHEAS